LTYQVASVTCLEQSNCGHGPLSGHLGGEGLGLVMFGFVLQPKVHITAFG